jgi:POT family proton-dependent oligopeptide transporter
VDNNNKQPPSLRVFFATEMWERYGFYVVQSLLALYLALHLQWPDKLVYELVGSFTALTYLSPVIGGWIADNLIGQKKAILVGLILLCLSYVSLFLFTSQFSLLASLAGIAVGTGLLKPNISSLLGNEYAANSSKRESGFTIFYMGLTTGIILGTTLPSQLKFYFGWSAAFISAAIGLIIAIGTFSYGIKHYKIADYHPQDITLSKISKATVLMFSLWLACFLILNYTDLADLAFIIIGVLSIYYLVHTVKQESGIQAKQTIVIGILCIISVAFWAFYFQMFLSLTLFISRVVKPELFGIMFPPPYYVSIQSFGMLFFGFFLARNKQLFNVTQSGIRASNKFMLAMIFMTIAYCLITLVSKTGGEIDMLLSPLYFIPAYLMISIAELLLSPVGLSIISLLADRKKVSTMTGTFLASLGIGAYLSGKLANLTAVTNSEELSIGSLKIHYAESFTEILYFIIAASLFCFLLTRMIKVLLTEK